MALAFLGAVACGGPAAARDGVRITVDRERTARGTAEQVRLGSTSGDVQLWGLVRRQDGGREWVRWSGEAARGADRWILGSTRGWSGGRSRGWGDALAARPGPDVPRATLAAAPAGATWIRGGRFGWVLGGGRGFDGRAEGLALRRAGSWSGGVEWRNGAGTGVLSWTAARGMPTSAEGAASAREGRLRVGLGGGRSDVGLVVDGHVRRDAAAEWTGRAAVQSGRDGARLRAGVDVRLRRGVPRSEGRLEWEWPTDAGVVRMWTRQRTGGAGGRAGVELAPPGRPAARLTLEFGGPRDRRRASCSLSGRAGAARIALRLDMPSGTGRRASLTAATGGVARSWRMRLDWRRGTRTAVRLTWSGTTGRGN